ncbi:putative oxidoreductase C736,13 OS=Schizosaccharomyces pombe (strain 972 / ATCC 24843) GN=SPCC736.13 PE=3 SV=1 [Rhizoctonia solani AG-1 IB]|uniref:Putative oxidoreductase C736,13 n=1 Tax=Thanatephorus cucumeris (strain AG1-IB / isolate 7/3/14) TaxID=1108050 RepID=A0A0B7G288_THACB|nr:putative oxidoreductase C736,13 OS=Schizosaccharomyces pombe (strain 972 / ATCC 24843) GN=SPCC736.13 PE=3 SV=1 [Rhizoctonia solani AG-1 IB]
MGVVYSILVETFPGAPRWSVNDIPDLSGQVVMVTGGNSGMGLELCKALLNKGAKVYMTARDREKADKAIEILKTETSGRSPVFIQLDLADLDSVRRAAENYKSMEEELHVLYNNAGVMISPTDLKTVNGYDLQFGTNVLGPYLFTTLLLSTLIHTAQTSPLAGGTARVINASSSVHWVAPRGGINYASLAPNDKDADKIRYQMGPTSLYAQSKWASGHLSYLFNN